MSDNLLTPDDQVRAVVLGDGIAIVETEGAYQHNYMHGGDSVTLAQKHIDALLAGYTLTFGVEEYQVFVSFERQGP